MKKIVIQVQDMGSDKCKSKALKIAAVCRGVQSVGIEGESKDLVVVTGDNIDSVCLTKNIRKKFRSANIVSVEDVKEEKKEEKKPEEPKTCCYNYYPPSCPYNYVYYPQPKSCFFL